MQFLDKQTPAAPETETVVLGAVLMDNSLIYQLANVLKPDNFFVPNNRRVYAAYLELFSQQKRIDPVLVWDILEKRNETRFFNAMSDITNLTYGLPHFSDITYYIGIIDERYRLRRLNEFFDRQSRKTYDLEESKIIVEESITALSKFQTNGNSERVNQSKAADTLRKQVKRWATSKDTDVGIITGIPEFDSRLGMKEFTGGSFTLLAALTSVGKSILLKQMTKFNAKREKKILYCTFEMPPDQLVKRMLPDVIGIPNEEINPFTARHNEEKLNKILRGIEIIESLPIFYEHTCRNDEKFRAVVNYYKRFYNIDGVMVDNLQNMTSKGAGNRNLELGQIARVLKETAMDNGLPVIAAAQAIREGGKLKIRDTGEAITHADNCWFFEEDSAEIDGVTMLKTTTDKQREGKRFYLTEKTIRLSVDKDYQRFLSPQMIIDENDAGGFEFLCEQILEQGYL